MTPFRGRMLAGAPGGYWEVFDESQHPTVVRQYTGNSCGPACAEMLFRSRGIVSISQQDIVAAQGNERSTDESPARAMNTMQEQRKLDDSGEWRAAWYDTLSAPDDLFRWLLRNGPFITSVKSFGSDSHMVVIDGFDSRNLVAVRAPYEGTRYYMRWEEFQRIWQGMSVWWSPRRL